MLITLFPRASETYSSLPLFGPVMDDFADWLDRQGYTYGSRRQTLWIVTWMDGYLRRRRIKRLQDLTPSALQGCWKALHRRLPPSAGAIHVMEQFLTLRGLLKPSPSRISSPTEIQVEKYSEYLRDVRGFSRSTIHSHLRAATDLLTHLGFDSQPGRLAGLEASDLESFRKSRNASTHSGCDSGLSAFSGDKRTSEAGSGKPDRYATCLPTGTTSAGLTLGDGSGSPSIDSARYATGPTRPRHAFSDGHLRPAFM